MPEGPSRNARRPGAQAIPIRGVQFEGGRLKILDLEQLQSIAEFELADLDLDRMRRGR